MSLVPDLDQYAKYLPIIGTAEMEREHLPAPFVERLSRIKAVYDHWRQFPNKRTADIVAFEDKMFGVNRSQSYDDIKLVKLLLGDIEASTKEFWRWRINTLTMDAIEGAREKKDYKSLSSLLKVLVQNNKTDKEDSLEMDFDRIVPQQFEMTDDIGIVIKGRKKTPRAKVEELLRKYGATATTQPATNGAGDYVDYEDETPPQPSQCGEGAN